MALVKGIEKAGENTKFKKGQKASANILSGGIVFYESCIFSNKNGRTVGIRKYSDYIFNILNSSILINIDYI